MRQRKRADVFYFLAPDSPGKVGGSWRPNVDIYETDAYVVVALEVPGVRPEDIEITQEAGRLVVKGQRRPTIREGSKHFHQIEIECGEFEKEVVLSDELRGAPVEATLSLGILFLRIQKETGKGQRGVTRIKIEAQ